jgi:hypothetical protein
VDFSCSSWKESKDVSSSLEAWFIMPNFAVSYSFSVIFLNVFSFEMILKSNMTHNIIRISNFYINLHIIVKCTTFILIIKDIQE